MTLDITDSKRVNGYVHYLIAQQNLDPICLDSKISKTQKPLVSEMKRVCKAIEAYLELCELHNLSAYARNYAMLYPFAYKRQLDAKFFAEIDFRILDAWQNGNQDVSEIEAYSLIGKHLKNLPANMKTWYQRKQGEYFADLDGNGKFVNVSLLENFRTLNGLWNDSIWNNHPDMAYGRNDIADANYVDDYKALDTETLCEYYRFLCHYGCDVSDRESAILEELSKREDLDEYDRRGYEIDGVVDREVCV
jgi:hypothetical protein